SDRAANHATRVLQREGWSLIEFHCKSFSKRNARGRTSHDDGLHHLLRSRAENGRFDARDLSVSSANPTRLLRGGFARYETPGFSVMVRSRTPPFSDRTRKRNSFAPGVSMRTRQVALRLSPWTMLPRLKARAAVKSISTLSSRRVST